MSAERPQGHQGNEPQNNSLEGFIPLGQIMMGAASEPFNLIFEQSHRITNLEALQNREHFARPYPATNYDFLAVNVPSSYQQGMIPDGEEPPWGMLKVVASSRETFEFNSGILDAHRLKLQPEDIKHQLEVIKPKLVGLNPTSVNVPEAVVVAEMCDQLGIPYILGGIHATLDPAIARQDFPNAYALVRGNGEAAIAEVIDAVVNGAPHSNGNGIYYHDHEIGNRFDYGKKLNPGEIPLVRQDVYIEEPVYKHTIQLNGTPTQINEATLFVTDGCPFECTFCSSPVMVNRGKAVPYARPEMERIVDEVEHVVRDVGADAIHFLDDMAFIKGQNIRDFHSSVGRRGLMGKFIWRGLTRAPVIIGKDFDQEVMEMMKETGAWKIALGVESGNDEVLKRIKKKVTKVQVIEAVSKLGSNGIQVKAFFIMGFPGETEAQIAETKDFVFQLKDLGLTEIGAFQFKPYPGTYEYMELLRLRPDIAPHLNYLRNANSGLEGTAKYRAEQKDVWLPDDLHIADVSSGVVREYVMSTLEKFYGTSFNDQKDPSCI